MGRGIDRSLYVGNFYHLAIRTPHRLFKIQGSPEGRWSQSILIDGQ
jgi:hypothetical protein